MFVVVSLHTVLGDVEPGQPRVTPANGIPVRREPRAQADWRSGVGSAGDAFGRGPA
jgi:hypothetical protein